MLVAKTNVTQDGLRFSLSSHFEYIHGSEFPDPPDLCSRKTAMPDSGSRLRSFIERFASTRAVSGSIKSDIAISVFHCAVWPATPPEKRVASPGSTKASSCAFWFRRGRFVPLVEERGDAGFSRLSARAIANVPRGKARAVLCIRPKRFDCQPCRRSFCPPLAATSDSPTSAQPMLRAVGSFSSITARNSFSASATGQGEQ